LIAKNTFSNNAAYFGTSAIFIRQYATKEIIRTDMPTIEADVECGGYLI
jgi:hypothetical protein